MSFQLPEFVNIGGKRTLTSSLPPALRESIARSQISAPQPFLKNIVDPNSRTKNLDAKIINDQNLAILSQQLAGASSPREAIALRERAINAGVKHTSLHLGAPTKEVLAQLNASKSQQNFQDKKISLSSQIEALEAKGIVAGNTSGDLGQARSRAKAQQVFSIQQQFTKAKSGQVREVLDSPEFSIIKAEGGDVQGFDLAGLLNQKGVSVPKFQTEIVNEIAQAQILQRSGFTNQVTVQNGVLSGLQDNPLLSDTQSTINTILTGTPITDFGFTSTDPLGGFDTGFFGGGESLQDVTEADGAGIAQFLPFIIIGAVGIGLLFILRGKL
jgi:hypothetical protein